MKTRKTEMEKINNELLDEVYPRAIFSKYFQLGVAETLSVFTDIFNEYLGNGTKEIAIDEINKIITYYVKQNKTVDEYYNRLRKDK